jgi:hypothetical protein
MRNELRQLTAKEAEEMGFTIDRHVFPWFAYKGARFKPDEFFTIGKYEKEELQEVYADTAIFVGWDEDDE